MSNYLIRQGQALSVKVPIPADLQQVFGKKGFKKSLKTSNKSIAVARSGPIIVHFKSEIEDAQGNPEAEGINSTLLYARAPSPMHCIHRDKKGDMQSKY